MRINTKHCRENRLVQAVPLLRSVEVISVFAVKAARLQAAVLEICDLQVQRPRSILVWTEEPLSVEVNQMRWRISDPDLCFPRNLPEIFHHRLTIQERGDENKAGF